MKIQAVLPVTDLVLISLLPPQCYEYSIVDKPLIQYAGEAIAAGVDTLIFVAGGTSVLSKTTSTQTKSSKWH